MAARRGHAWGGRRRACRRRPASSADSARGEIRKEGGGRPRGVSRIRIVHVAESAGWAGGEVYLRELARVLDRARFELAVIAPEAGRLVPRPEALGVETVVLPLRGGARAPRPLRAPPPPRPPGPPAPLPAPRAPRPPPRRRGFP